jgi:hypothetical protein
MSSISLYINSFVNNENNYLKGFILFNKLNKLNNINNINKLNIELPFLINDETRNIINKLIHTNKIGYIKDSNWIDTYFLLDYLFPYRDNNIWKRFLNSITDYTNPYQYLIGVISKSYYLEYNGNLEDVLYPIINVEHTSITEYILENYIFSILNCNPTKVIQYNKIAHLELDILETLSQKTNYPFIQHIPSKNIIKNKSNIIIAGGSIVTAVFDLPMRNYSDIDFWVYGEDRLSNMESWSNLIKYLWHNLPCPTSIVINNGIASLIPPKPHHKLQVILTEYKHPNEIIYNFDLNYVQSYFTLNTKKLYMTCSCLESWMSKQANCFNKNVKIKEERLYKLYEKGFFLTEIENKPDFTLIKKSINEKSNNHITIGLQPIRAISILKTKLKYYNQIVSNPYDIEYNKIGSFRCTFVDHYDLNNNGNNNGDIDEDEDEDYTRNTFFLKIKNTFNDNYALMYKLKNPINISSPLLSYYHNLKSYSNNHLKLNLYRITSMDNNYNTQKLKFIDEFEKQIKYLNQNIKTYFEQNESINYFYTHFKEFIRYNIISYDLTLKIDENAIFIEKESGKLVDIYNLNKDCLIEIDIQCSSFIQDKENEYNHINSNTFILNFKIVGGRIENNITGLENNDICKDKEILYNKLKEIIK